MSERLGPVDIEFALKNVNFKQEAGKIKGEISGISQTAQREVGQTNELLRTLGRGVAAYFSFQALQGFGQQLIAVRGEFENLGIAFETMLGNKEKADKLMADVVQMAATTPFSLTEVSQGVKQLLAYQESQETVIDTTTRLGNISAGLGVPLGRLIMVYGQVSAKGKLMGDDLRQFTEAGIPMVAELAKQFEVTDAQIYEMVSQGKVGFADVQAVLKNLTNEGGMFFNLMEKQSKSLTGMISNLGDAWDRMLNDVGESNQDTLKGGVQLLISMVENYETILDIIKVLIATYGAYKAAIIAISITEKIRYQITLAQMASTKGLTTLEALHAVVLGKVKDAQALLNKTILKNPYAAAAALIGGLIAALVLFTKSTDAASIAQGKLDDAARKAVDGVASEQSRIKILIDTLKNENASRDEKAKAIKELNEISPEYLGHLNAENAATEEGKRAIDAYLESLKQKIEVQELEREMAESIRRQNAAARGDVDLRWGEQLRMSLLLNVGALKQVAKDATNDINDVIELEKQVQDKISARIQELISPEGGAAGGGGGEKAKNTIKELKKELAELQKQREERTDKDDKAELDRLAKLIVAKQKELEKFKIEAQKTDKRTDIDIFKDDLKEKKELYAQFEAYKRVVGEQEAQEMYANLLKQGDSYITYLRRKLETLPNGDKKAILATEIVANDKDKAKDDNAAEEALKQLLERTKDYNQRRADLEKQYQAELAQLREHGTDGQIAELTRQHNEEMAALEAKHLNESASYQWIFADIERMNRQALKDYIERLREEVNAKAWSDEAKLTLSEKLAEAEQKLADTVPDNLSDVAGVLREAASLAGELDEELAKAINTAAELADAASNIAMGLATSNPFQVAGGILQAATSLIKYFSSGEQMKKATEELTESLSAMNDQLSRQATMLNNLADSDKLLAYADMLNGLGAQADKTKEQLFNLVNEMNKGGTLDGMYRFAQWINGDLAEAKEKDAFQQALKDTGLSVGNIENWSDDDWIRLIGQASGETKKQLEGLYDQWVELKQQQEEYYQQWAEMSTGMSFDTFTNEFLEALQSGERSAQDFADNVEDMLRTAIIQGFKTQYLVDALKPWYDQFAQFAEDGLSEKEIEELRERFQQIFADAGEAFDALGSVVDLTGAENDPNSLSGAIKGMSQDTAELLAGQFNAIRVNTAEHLNVARNALMYQAETARNTDHMVRLMSGANELLARLESIDKNLSNDPLRGKGL